MKSIMKRIISYIFYFTLFLFSYSFVVFADSTANLTDCHQKETEQGLEVTLKCTKTVKYSVMTLKDPDRLVVDLMETDLKTTLPATENDFFVKMRGSDHNHDYLRIVFDLKDKLKYSSRFDKDKHELVVLLKKNAGIAEKKEQNVKEEVATLPIAKELQTSHGVTEPVTSSVSKPTLKLEDTVKAKKVVIVIDPGHGGKDPGAEGPNGGHEKDVVLKISKHLQSLLNEEPGFTAVLTRSTDIYIPLRKRLAIARKNHADMFIAIHADAYNAGHATGASVYALSQRGATSEAARWLAEKENESELGGLSDELADKDAMLRSVLIDLSQTHTIESSLGIGHKVLHNLGLFARLHHPRVEQAAFVVLKSPDIPSILVETGFITNPFEEEKLTNPDYQYQTAQAIKEGIKQYFVANAPSGTWFAANR